MSIDTIAIINPHIIITPYVPFWFQVAPVLIAQARYAFSPSLYQMSPNEAFLALFHAPGDLIQFFYFL
mgnify:CR=1 FL=1